ncbi:hypothetical protein V8C86DRAFT_3114750 [Haematococcus lacustris]
MRDPGTLARLCVNCSTTFQPGQPLLPALGSGSGASPTTQRAGDHDATESDLDPAYDTTVLGPFARDRRPGHAPTPEEEEEDEEEEGADNMHAVNGENDTRTAVDSDEPPGRAAGPARQPPHAPASDVAAAASAARERSDQTASLIAEKLLQGWALLDTCCPRCSTPLVRSRTPRRMFCVACSMWVMTEAEAAQAAAAAPAPAPPTPPPASPTHAPSPTTTSRLLGPRAAADRGGQQSGQGACRVGPQPYSSRVAGVGGETARGRGAEGGPSMGGVGITPPTHSNHLNHPALFSHQGSTLTLVEGALLRHLEAAALALDHCRLDQDTGCPAPHDPSASLPPPVAQRLGGVPEGVRRVEGLMEAAADSLQSFSSARASLITAITCKLSAAASLNPSTLLTPSGTPPNRWATGSGSAARGPRSRDVVGLGAWLGEAGGGVGGAGAGAAAAA